MLLAFPVWTRTGYAASTQSKAKAGKHSSAYISPGPAQQLRQGIPGHAVLAPEQPPQHRPPRQEPQGRSSPGTAPKMQHGKDVTSGESLLL